MKTFCYDLLCIPKSYNLLEGDSVPASLHIFRLLKAGVGSLVCWGSSSFSPRRHWAPYANSSHPSPATCLVVRDLQEGRAGIPSDTRFVLLQGFLTNTLDN